MRLMLSPHSRHKSPICLNYWASWQLMWYNLNLRFVISVLELMPLMIARTTTSMFRLTLRKQIMLEITTRKIIHSLIHLIRGGEIIQICHGKVNKMFSSLQQVFSRQCTIKFNIRLLLVRCPWRMFWLIHEKYWSFIPKTWYNYSESSSVYSEHRDAIGSASKHAKYKTTRFFA